MTKEEAIRLLKTQRINGDDLHKAFDMAIEALEDSRWIPVTERLPGKENKKYVVTLDNGEVENRWWLGCFWIESVGRVVAWMPLPKPYKEGAEE